METFIHCEEFLVLHIGRSLVLLWPVHYTGRVSDDWQSIHVDLVLPIELAFQDLSVPSVVFGCCYFPCLLKVVPILLWDTKVLVMVHMSAI